MVLEIRRLYSKGEYSGSFSFEFMPPPDVLLLPLCRVEGAVSVSGKYEIFDNGDVEVSLGLRYALSGSCSYCLNEASTDIEYKTDITFVTDKEDLDNYYYDGNRLDLSKAVNDAMIFSQPSVLLCADCAAEKNTEN